MPRNDALQADAGDGSPVTAEAQREIEQFLFREAALLDDRCYDDWLELLAEDLHYVMPLRTSRGPRERNKEFSGANDLAYFDDSKTSMAFRVEKLRTGTAWAEEPPSRTRHMVTNVRIWPGAQPGEFAVTSAFLVYRSRSEHQTDLFVGERRDGLRRVKSVAGFEIFRRQILIDQATLLANNISFFF